MKLQISTYIFSLYFLFNLCYTQTIGSTLYAPPISKTPCLFADYCIGKIWSFEYQSQKNTEYRKLTEIINLADGEHTIYISSFGEDLIGALYIVDYSGDIYKIGHK